jgi:hypothetical protein
VRPKIVYRNRPINVRAVLVAVVVGLAVCIAVTAYLDYVVLDWVIGIGYQPNALYGDCLNAEMLAIVFLLLIDKSSVRQMLTETNFTFV